jgi:hypothetical protein
MSFISNSALGFFLQTISLLQIAFHIPLMNIQFPANAIAYFKTVIPIVNFDLLGSFDLYNDLLNFVSRLTVHGKIDEDFDPSIPQ